MNKELEQEIFNEIKEQNLNDFANYLGIDLDDLENLYFDCEFDDYSG